MKDWIKYLSKFWSALGGSVLGIIVILHEAGFDLGALTDAQWGAIAALILAPFGVYRLRNGPRPGTPPTGGGS